MSQKVNDSRLFLFLWIEVNVGWDGSVDVQFYIVSFVRKCIPLNVDAFVMKMFFNRLSEGRTHYGIFHSIDSFRCKNIVFLR